MTQVTRDWLDELEPRCGPLVPVARAFLRDRSLGGFPRGADGVRLVAALLDGQLERDASEDDDRAFIEGVGALLGLVLVDRVGDGEHVEHEGVHRVRLGPRGFFNPFRAIESALESDAPRATLRAAIAVAESEARDEGPGSRVIAALERTVTKLDLGLEVRERHPRWVVLGTETEPSAVRVELGPTIDATSGESAKSVEQAVSKIVSLFPGAPDTRTEQWNDIRPRLVPRLVGAAFEERIPSNAPQPLVAPWVGELRIAYQLLFDGRARYVATRELEDWCLQEAELRVVALANLTARSERLRLKDVGDGVVMVRVGDGLDAARILIPGLRKSLLERVGEDAVVALPHRDAFYVTTGANEAALRERAAHEASRAPHAICDRVWKLAHFS